MKKLVLATGIASLGLVTCALAGGPNHAKPVINDSIYLGLNGGVAIPSQNNDLDTGYNLGTQIGYRMDNWRIEEAYNFYSQDSYGILGLSDVRHSTLRMNGCYDFHNGCNTLSV